QAEDGIRDFHVTGVQTCALPISARLFAERGFDGTSMDDIAKELGMLKGSLYYWIQSKEALLNDVLSRNPILEENAVCEKILSRRSEEHTSELQSRENLVCRLLLE